ncbi:MAG: UDPglucose 6-dehydrogenase [Myxococcota bacterium]|jgi:UDPglucose 6-dehydrogenase
MHISVIGTGYVGLVAGACFAELGNDVTCIDVDEAKIAMLNWGEIPIYEPGLKDIVERNARQGRLKFTTDGDEALKRAQVVFIAVGTPSDEDGRADLKYVCAVAEEVGQKIEREGVVVVCKSTVPIGTNARVKSIVSQNARVPFHVVSNPEFLKEGDAVKDFMKPDRIVVGHEHPSAGEVMDELYEPLVRTGAPILHMDIASAEMTKYAANCMLATRISFMNEIANLCEAVGADVTAVRRGIGTDPRIGKHFLFPGVGFGGSCFPKDVRALVRVARENDTPLKVVEAVETANEKQKMLLAELVKRHFGASVKGLKVGVWGLAFKARTDDMREAPSITIINALLEAGATVAAYDPEAGGTAKHVFGDTITFCENAYDVADGAGALLVVTDWNAFRAPDFDRIKSLMTADPAIFDGRNLWRPEKLRDLGFTYYAVGRGLNPKPS